jgi:hypothetical protein
VVLCLGVQRHEIPEGVVGALRLWDLPVGMRLRRVDDVRELDRVLDEEDRDVVADQVEGAFFGVELVVKPQVSRTVSAEPREPSTVEKRTKTGVSCPFLRNPARVIASAVP